MADQAKQPVQGWPCPNCDGDGTVLEEFATPGRANVTVLHYVPCRVCRGKGRVAVVPLPDGEGADHG